MAVKTEMNPPSLGQTGNTALVTVKGFHIKNHNIPLRVLWDTDFKGVENVVKYVHLNILIILTPET